MKPARFMCDDKIYFTYLLHHYPTAKYKPVGFSGIYDNSLASIGRDRYATRLISPYIDARIR